MLTVNWNCYHYYQKISKGPGGACVRWRGRLCHGTMASPILVWVVFKVASWSPEDAQRVLEIPAGSHLIGNGVEKSTLCSQAVNTQFWAVTWLLGNNQGLRFFFLNIPRSSGQTQCSCQTVGLAGKKPHKTDNVRFQLSRFTMHIETSVTALDVALPHNIEIQRVIVLTNSNKCKITVGHWLIVDKPHSRKPRIL